jgi:chitosanase
MQLTSLQKRICEQVINVFETGKIEGDYGALVIFADGPHDIRQITYGRSQTTEYGNLEELVQMYVDANGTFSEKLRPFIEQIGVTPLVENQEFKQLLRDAGRKDPVMQRIQDDFFDKRYFQPAMGWADTNEFMLPLSALVIYDSFIHSGSILDFLRKRFPEVPPAKGGNEKTWIQQYVDVRQNWLATHPRKVLQNTVYRTQCFKREIARDNWDLSQVPVNANGVNVFGQ